MGDGIGGASEAYRPPAVLSIKIKIKKKEI
jgi:hypothetical protein